MNAPDAILARFEERIGHGFADRSLLAQALLHAGAAGEGDHGNERLEFLGDRVLGLLIAEALIHKFPDEPEGDLAKRLAHLARRDALARVAEQVGLGEALTLSRGDEDLGNRANPSILADAMEAVVAAVYLDGGLEDARRLVIGRWGPLMAEDPEPPRDPKTVLQEWVLARAMPLPSYVVVRSEGPAHRPEFEIAVNVAGMEPAHGVGASKRAAERLAARALLTRLGVASHG